MQNRTTTLAFGLNSSGYQQGAPPGAGYDQNISLQVRFLDNLTGQPVPGANCSVINNVTSDNISLSYNSSSGNYTGMVDDYLMYGNVSFNATCFETNYSSSSNSTAASVTFSAYLWEWQNLSYSTGSNGNISEWLRRQPPNGPLVILNESVNYGTGSSIVAQFPLYGYGVNGSVATDYLLQGNHSISMNVSLTSALASSCQAYLCANQTDFNLNPVDLECMPEQSLAAGVPTLLTNTSQTNITLRQGDYLFLSLYLNCSAPASGNVSIYYNYTGEPAGLKALNAIPTLLNSFTSARIQLENSYLIGPFQELNTSRITYVTFNNTQAHPFYTEYNFVSQILSQYPNSNIPNTIYVYNSTGGLWASDNVSAGAPNVVVSYSDNHESWLTEVFPANTALNESLVKNILNGIRDNESLVSSTPDVKSWNISVFTIFNNAVTLYNVTSFTNYSAYNAQDNFTFMVNFTNGSGTYDISSFVVKNTTAKTLTFPVMNLTGAVSFTVYAINTTAPVITFVNPTPANGSSRNLSWAYINVTADKNLTSAILDWNGTNYTMDGSGANWFFNETNLRMGYTLTQSSPMTP